MDVDDVEDCLRASISDSSASCLDDPLRPNTFAINRDPLVPSRILSTSFSRREPAGTSILTNFSFDIGSLDIVFDRDEEDCFPRW